MIVVAKWIECDNCGSQHPGDLSFAGAHCDLRSEAKNLGWINRKGKDLCPCCTPPPHQRRRSREGEEARIY